MNDSRIAMRIEYDGTGFHGFQRQAGFRTVESVLAEALRRTLGEPSDILVASRTDAGVHAVGQTVAFDVRTPVPAGRMPMLLNTVLPSDLAVHRAAVADESFHPRFDAVGKTYRYRICARGTPAPLLRRHAFLIRPVPDVAAMREAAAAMTGTRDFSSFRDTGCGASSTVRTVTAVEVEAHGEGTAPEGLVVDIRVSGDAFLYHMVRIIAGTLVDVGIGRIRADSIPEILASRDRRQAGRTAPPEGLCLMSVAYGERCPFCV